jgi:hypothetical protein
LADPTIVKEAIIGRAGQEVDTEGMGCGGQGVVVQLQAVVVVGQENSGGVVSRHQEGEPERIGKLFGARKICSAARDGSDRNALFDIH